METRASLLLPWLYVAALAALIYCAERGFVDALTAILARRLVLG